VRGEGGRYELGIKIKRRDKRGDGREEGIAILCRIAFSIFIYRRMCIFIAIYAQVVLDSETQKKARTALEWSRWHVISTLAV